MVVQHLIRNPRLEKEQETSERELHDSIVTMERLRGIAPLNMPRTLENESDYDAALVAVAHLMEQEPQLGTDESERLIQFYECIEVYEDAHYPLDR